MDELRERKKGRKEAKKERTVRKLRENIHFLELPLSFPPLFPLPPLLTSFNQLLLFLLLLFLPPSSSSFPIISIGHRLFLP